jgi:hypothetical protein
MMMVLMLIIWPIFLAIIPPTNTSVAAAAVRAFDNFGQCQCGCPCGFVPTTVGTFHAVGTIIKTMKFGAIGTVIPLHCRLAFAN